MTKNMLLVYLEEQLFVLKMAITIEYIAEHDKNYNVERSCSCHIRGKHLHHNIIQGLSSFCRIVSAANTHQICS